MKKRIPLESAELFDIRQIPGPVARFLGFDEVFPVDAGDGQITEVDMSMSMVERAYPR